MQTTGKDWDLWGARIKIEEFIVYFYLVKMTTIWIYFHGPKYLYELVYRTSM